MKFSIIIPVYKTPMKLLRECVASCVGVKDAEIICILDSPGDACEEVLDQIAAECERVKVLKNDVNRGVSYSRNRGIEAAQGEFITFVDADDQIDTKVYEEGLNLAENEGLDAVSVGGINEVAGLKKGEVVFGRYDDEEASDLLKILECVGMSSCSVLYRMEKLKAITARFDETLSNNEDFVFYTHCVMAGFELGLYYAGGYIQVGHPESATRAKVTSRQLLSCGRAASQILHLVEGKCSARGVVRHYASRVFYQMTMTLDVFRVLTQEEKRLFASQLGANAKLFRKTLVGAMSIYGKALVSLLSIAPWLYTVSEWAIARPMLHWGRKLWR